MIKTALSPHNSSAHTKHSPRPHTPHTPTPTPPSQLCLTFSWALLAQTDHRIPGYPGSVVPPGLKAAKKLSRGAAEQTGIDLLTQITLCMQLLSGLEEGSYTEVTGEIPTPFISPDGNLLLAAGETTPARVWFLQFISA